MASNTIVQTNILALNSHRNLGQIGVMKEKASARLSSGFRINTAADDAAGLAISEKMRAQIRGLNQASRNANDGISMLQTAEGGLAEINNMIMRIRELTVQAANDTNDQVSGDRHKIQLEIGQMLQEVRDMGERVEFNKMSVLNMTTNTMKSFQIGANVTQFISFDFARVNVATKILNLIADVNVDNKITGEAQTATDISEFLSAIDKSLGITSEGRAELGATQNRIEFTNRSLLISSENLSGSESRIRDADMAKEMMELTKANILQQAGVAMLAQANQAPQGILQLLQ